ncbi:MAG: FGGY family carbohydrate kinase, partial [Erysipelotrichaceae bacterium]|nr:FGGY family carbohydrate kinase [Erysipelotrichaceae bacterium]
TWGVDYVLMNNDNEILPCYSYRDDRTDSVINKVHDIIPFEKLYEMTGCQFQKFNSIYQLYYDKINHRLDNATSFLHIPEYLIYKLTGKKVKEYTNASTTGMLDKNTNYYSLEIIEKLDLNKDLFTKLYKPGYVVGDFKDDVKKIVNGNIKVVLCPTHDTASAVEGIKMSENAPYISSGTWSLLGIKINNAITSKEALKANFSNEYGPNYIRFQKNIMGLWIIQSLAKQMNLSFSEMVEMAKNSSYNNIYDVDDPCFLSSLDMKNEIKNWYVKHQMTPPILNKDFINATYHSLAYSYNVAIKELEKITNMTFDKLYIVGGGAKNQYLNDLTKLYCKKEVIALPIEATAKGNLLSQMEK